MFILIICSIIIYYMLFLIEYNHFYVIFIIYIKNKIQPYSECEYMCCLRSCFRTNILSQWSHLMFLAPVCITIWDSTCAFWVKDFPHTVHLKFFWPAGKEKKKNIFHEHNSNDDSIFLWPIKNKLIVVLY